MTIRLLLIDEEPERAALMADALADEGYQVIRYAPGLGPVADVVQREQPDVVVIDLASPDRDTLEDMRGQSGAGERPVVMFVTDASEDVIAESVRAGVTAYARDSVPQARVKPLLDLAVAQFRRFRALQVELDQARQSLAERKAIDRAKGILMAQRQLSETDAYHALRRMAMDRGIKLAQLAEQVIAAEALLRP